MLKVLFIRLSILGEWILSIEKIMCATKKLDEKHVIINILIKKK
jgi:hypothetical protein